MICISFLFFCIAYGPIHFLISSKGNECCCQAYFAIEYRQNHDMMKKSLHTYISIYRHMLIYIYNLDISRYKLPTTIDFLLTNFIPDKVKNEILPLMDSS